MHPSCGLLSKIDIKARKKNSKARLPLLNEIWVLWIRFAASSGMKRISVQLLFRFGLHVAFGQETTDITTDPVKREAMHCLYSWNGTIRFWSRSPCHSLQCFCSVGDGRPLNARGTSESVGMGGTGTSVGVVGLTLGLSLVHVLGG